MSDIIDLDSEDINDLLEDEPVDCVDVPDVLNLDNECIFIKFFAGTKIQLNVVQILKALEKNEVIIRGIFKTSDFGSAYVLEALKSDSLSQLLKVRFEARQKCRLNAAKSKKIFDICKGKFKIKIGDQELYFILLNDVVFATSPSPNVSSQTKEGFCSLISKEIVSGKSVSNLFNEAIEIIASTSIIELNNSPIIALTRGMRIEKGEFLSKSVRIRFLFEHKILVPSLCEFLREKFSCKPANGEVPMLIPKASLKSVTESNNQSQVPSNCANFLSNSKRELGIIKSVSDSMFGNDSRDRPNLNIGTVNFFLGNHPSSQPPPTSSTYANPNGSIFKRLGPKVDGAQIYRQSLGIFRGKSNRTRPYAYRGRRSQPRGNN
jgi:hypothetical protein